MASEATDAPVTVPDRADTGTHSQADNAATATGRKKSLAWDHFTPSATRECAAICDLCGVVVLRGGRDVTRRSNTSNLRTHLSAKHPPEFRTILAKEKEMQDSIQQEKQLQMKRKADLPSRQTCGKTQMTLFDINARRTGWGSKDEKTLEYHRLITEMIALDNQPFNIVNNVGFQRLMKRALPHYILPTNTYISNTLLPDLYSKIRSDIKSELDRVLADYPLQHLVSTTSDIWSGEHESLISLTAHYVNEKFVTRDVVLHAKTINSQHTGENIAAHITEMLDSWELNGKIHCLVADNASSMKKAIRLLGNVDYFGCASHSIQLVLNTGLLSQRAVTDILGIARTISNTFGKSKVLAQQRLKSLQRQAGLKEHQILQDIKTRWNSSFYMLQRILEQKKALSLYSLEYGMVTFTNYQWELIEKIVCLLEPIEELTRQLSSEPAPASLVIPLVRTLEKMLADKSDDYSGVLSFKEKMLEDLQRRFNGPQTKLEENRTLAVATFLDPRFKHYYFTKDDLAGLDTDGSRADTHLDKVKKWIVEEGKLIRLHQNRPRGNVQVHSVSDSATVMQECATGDSQCGEKRARQASGAKISKFYKCLADFQPGFLQQKDPPSTDDYNIQLGLDINNYISTSVSVEHASKYANIFSIEPLKWWFSEHGNSFPHLKVLARKYLGCPATSVLSERLFSGASLLYDDRRSCLAGERAEMLLFVRHNLTTN